MNDVRYSYEPGGRVYSREELRAEVESEAATLDSTQWVNGEFEFAEWLSDSIVAGSVKKIFAEE